MRPQPTIVHLTKSECKWLENWLTNEGSMPTEDADIKMANKVLNQMGSLALINQYGDVVYVGKEDV